MSVADGFGMHIETVMQMPFLRFMALQRLAGRRQIETRNRRAREEYERAKE